MFLSKGISRFGSLADRVEPQPTDLQACENDTHSCPKFAPLPILLFVLSTCPCSAPKAARKRTRMRNENFMCTLLSALSLRITISTPHPPPRRVRRSLRCGRIWREYRGCNGARVFSRILAFLQFGGRHFKGLPRPTK